METRGKYGAHGSTTQHQHLFKPIHSAVDKYPTKGNLHGANGSLPNSSYNQFKQQSDNLQANPGETAKRDSKGKPPQNEASVGQGGATTLKSYSGRGPMTRVPSQIINPAAVVLRDSSGH